MAVSDDAWEEVCLISIAKQAGSDYEFAALTQDIDVSGGEKDFEGVANAAGGRIKKHAPETDTIITLNMLPTGIDGLATSPTGIENLFHGFTSSNTGNNSRTRDLFRIAFLWTNDPAATSGAGATAAATNMKRFVIAEAEIISSPKTWSPTDPLKNAVKIKCSAFDKSGNGNILEEGYATATTTLSSYTSATKFR